MKLENQVASLELAKKLKELGVKQESYFAWVLSAPFFDGNHSERDLVLNPNQFEELVENCGDEFELYPAYTVAELGEMLPEEILDEEEPVSWHHLYTYPTGAHWCCSYRFHNGEDGTWSTTYVEQARTEANARAKMLIYLIENKLVDPISSNER